MIGFFRRAMSSWLVLGLLGLVLIAFIITGIGDPFGGGGGGGNRLATVGKSAVYDTLIRQQLDGAVRAARQQDPQVDTATYVRAGGFDQILNQTIVSSAITQWAEKYGFAVSNRQIDGEIASIPAFQVAGRFDQSMYEQALAQQRMSDRELRDDLRRELLRNQVILPITSGAFVPEGMVRPYAELLMEERTGTIGVIPAQLLAEKTPPSDADITQFYKKNHDRYMLPERRVIRYAIIDTSELGNVPSEADIEKYFRDNQAQYAASETRVLQQVILPDENSAKAFVAAARKGEPFAKLAASKGYSAADTAIGEQSLADFSAATSAQIAKAAFAANQGEVTDAVRSDFGWHVVRVDAIRTKAGLSLEQARPAIAATLTQQNRDNAALALVSEIENAFGDGKSMAEVLKAHNLTEQRTPALTVNGEAPSQPDYRPDAIIAALLKSSFAMMPDDDPVVEHIGDQFVLAGLGDVLESAPRPLNEIKEVVAIDFARNQAFEKGRTLASKIIAAVKAGTPLPKALADAGMPAPQTATNRRIDIAARGEQVPPPLAALFSMPVNGIRMLEAPGDQGWFVIRVDAVKKGDLTNAESVIQSTRAQFNQFAGEEYAAQFARAVTKEIGVKRNEAAIDRLRNELIGSAVDDQ